MMKQLSHGLIPKITEVTKRDIYEMLSGDKDKVVW
jgi:hypothetical protein